MTTEQQAAIERLSAENALLQLQIERIRQETIEECAKVADSHLARVGDHHPDKPNADRVAWGYGNASLNIAAAIRSLPAQREQPTDYEALEREHLGDPDKRTGIYATPCQPASAAQGAMKRACGDDECQACDLVPDNWPAEFLSKRLARVAKAVGYPMPDMTHEGIAECAATILGGIALKLESAALPSAAPIAPIEEREAVMELEIASLRRRAEQAEEQLAAALAAPALPEGHAIVPIEPTPEMLEAAMPAYSSNPRASTNSARSVYSRMLAAAPIPADPKNHLGHEDSGKR